MKAIDIRERIVDAGVKNLKVFGYPGVTATNILTDPIYSEFFRSMLKDNLGKGYDKIVNGLLSELPEGK